MIGQDLAFDEKGNSHSKGFDFGEKFSGLKVYKVVLFDCVAKDLEIQIAMIFDQQSILEYLSLYEMFISSHYYLKYYETSILSLNELCIKSASVAIRNADITCFLPLLTHGQFLQNIPSMLPNVVHSLKAENCMIVLRNKALYQRFNLNDFGYIDTGTHVSPQKVLILGRNLAVKKI